jgi:hypothetical protein
VRQTTVAFSLPDSFIAIRNLSYGPDCGNPQSMRVLVDLATKSLGKAMAISQRANCVPVSGGACG